MRSQFLLCYLVILLSLTTAHGLWPFDEIQKALEDLFGCGCSNSDSKSSPPAFIPSRGPSLPINPDLLPWPQANPTPAEPSSNPIQTPDLPETPAAATPAPEPPAAPAPGLIPQAWPGFFVNTFQAIRDAATAMGRQISRLLRRSRRTAPRALELIQVLRQITDERCFAIGRTMNRASGIPNNEEFDQILRDGILPGGQLTTSCGITKNIIRHLLMTDYGATETNITPPRLPSAARAPQTDYIRNIETALNDGTLIQIQLTPEHFFFVHRDGDHVYIYNAFQDYYSIRRWLAGRAPRFELTRFLELLKEMINDSSSQTGINAIKELFGGGNEDFRRRLEHEFGDQIIINGIWSYTWP